MEKIRVFVVDDSSVVRRLVTEELSAQPDLEVAGTAQHGREAIDKMTALDPDLVILDIEMPQMDGLTALDHLRQSHPRTPVIMFSALTELGAAATLEALSRGATDFFAKPSGGGDLNASRAVIRTELIPAIRTLGVRRTKPRVAPTPATVTPKTPSPPPPPLPPARVERIDLVVIGASTGGPNALAEVFASFPRTFPVPILIAQHMPPMFTRLLAERLTKHSPIPTAEAQPGIDLEPGKAWIAPGDFHLVVVRDGTRVRLAVNQDPPENACRPAVDPLFRSAAAVYGAHCLGVVLTGMGQDGLRGSQAIRTAGGQVVAQDEATSVVWGMPGAVARAGLADKVLPLPLISLEIVRRTRIGRG